MRWVIGLLLTSLLVANQAEGSEIMVASWYGGQQAMANGERFNPNDADIVAHRTLPFGTALRLTNPKNKRSIVCHVRDRGPHVVGRQLDLSERAAKLLGVSGVAALVVDILYVPHRTVKFPHTKTRARHRARCHVSAGSRIPRR